MSLVPILEPFWRRLVKLFKTVTLPSKRMERQTTSSIAGHTSLHKSLSPQKEKSRIAIKTTVPQSPINFTPNTCCSAAETLIKNEKFALKFASSAFLRRSCTGRSQGGFTLNSDWSIWIWARADNTTLNRIQMDQSFGPFEDGWSGLPFHSFRRKSNGFK